jgi:hypothetical protein
MIDGWMDVWMNGSGFIPPGHCISGKKNHHPENYTKALKAQLLNALKDVKNCILDGEVLAVDMVR